jgi:hypothetical protein
MAPIAVQASRARFPVRDLLMWNWLKATMSSTDVAYSIVATSVGIRSSYQSTSSRQPPRRRGPRSRLAHHQRIRAVMPESAAMNAATE